MIRRAGPARWSRATVGGSVRGVRRKEETDGGHLRGRPSCLVVECRHHGLAGAGCRDNEVLMPVVAISFDHEILQHALLMGVRPHIEAGKRDRRLTQRPTIFVLV